MITYLLKESDIFYVNFSETVTVEDIKNYLVNFETLDNLPQHLRSIYDLRGAHMNLKAEEIMDIAELTEKVTASYKSVKTAFLVDKPKLTAYSLIFSIEHDLENTTRLVFSQEKEALSWLNG